MCAALADHPAESVARVQLVPFDEYQTSSVIPEWIPVAPPSTHRFHDVFAVEKQNLGDQPGAAVARVQFAPSEVYQTSFMMSWL